MCRHMANGVARRECRSTLLRRVLNRLRSCPGTGQNGIPGAVKGELLFAWPSLRGGLVWYGDFGVAVRPLNSKESYS
jgi:hypothetical protein